MIENFLHEASERRSRGDIAGAIAACRQAVAQAPNDERGHSRLAHLTLESFDFATARSAFEACVKIAPDNVGFRNNYGMMLIYVGDFDGAREQFRAAIAIDRSCVPAYYNLAPIAPPTDAPALADALEGFKRLASSDLEQSMIGFALGKLYDDLGEWDRAFENFLTGNRLKGAQYDHAATLEFFESSKAAFANVAPRSSKGDTGEPQQRPIFMVGMPRSGSSLVEEILTRREGVVGLGERNEMPNLVKVAGQRHASGLGYPKCAPHLSEGELDELAERYLASINRQAKGAPCVIDKQLLNFQYAPLLKMMLPSAVIIHCVRNPIDTCLSTWFTNFQSGFSFSFDLADTGRYFRAYHDLMAYWEELLPDGILTVRYEDVVSDQDAVLGRLQDSLNLPASAAAAARAPRNIRTSSAWQVRQPIYTHAVARWKNYEKHLEPLINALGDLA